jgi:hypothetical protein
VLFSNGVRALAQVPAIDEHTALILAKFAA